MRNPEQTIGNLIDKQKVSFIASISAEGFPNMKAMLPPRKRVGIKEFWFTTNTSSMRVAQYRENPNASIYLTDDADTIMRKCKRAVTDSEAQILYRDEQPGVKNLLNIYCACTGKTPDEAVREFDGKGYGELKPAVGEAVVSVLRPIQERIAELEKDKAYIDSVIKNNAEKANYYAMKTLRKVQRKVGFPDRIR